VGEGGGGGRGFAGWVRRETWVGQNLGTTVRKLGRTPAGTDGRRPMPRPSPFQSSDLPPRPCPCGDRHRRRRRRRCRRCSQHSRHLRHPPFYQPSYDHHCCPCPSASATAWVSLFADCLVAQWDPSATTRSCPPLTPLPHIPYILFRQHWLLLLLLLLLPWRRGPHPAEKTGRAAMKSLYSSPGAHGVTESVGGPS
jgi:hypothetical protein